VSNFGLAGLREPVHEGEVALECAAIYIYIVCVYELRERELLE
jgi:hypothetical protein